MPLEHTYKTDGSVTNGDVRDAFEAELTDEDVTEKSPVSAGGTELAVLVDGTDLVVREEGHEGEWSKTSEQAVKHAVLSVDGVIEGVEYAGGYDSGD